jgi:hypothetical protein
MKKGYPYEQHFHRQPVISKRTTRILPLAQSEWLPIRGAPLRVERKTYLNRHLPMSNLAFLDLSASLKDLEPTKVSQALRSLGNGILNCVLDAVSGRADEFDLLVDMITHPSRIRLCASQHQSQSFGAQNVISQIFREDKIPLAECAK